MEFLLNEKSLEGQFDSITSFLMSIKPVIKNIELIHKSNMPIYKTTDFYNCKITKNKKLCDLKNCEYAEELLRLKLSLDREIYDKPQWDMEPFHDLYEEFMWNKENVTTTSLAEAAIRNGALLSFYMEVFKDKILEISNEQNTYYVNSIYTRQYLVEKYRDQMKIEPEEYLKIICEDTRIDCSTLEEKYGAKILEKDEFDSLITTLNKFINHESWETIAIDDGLEYKKYTPKEKKKNWFVGSKYSGKTIMKFRFSDTMRCFGYRKGDKFKILRLERDHTISNNG